ncbi:hypothetical protein [Saccharopolyspora pogona]|uniref:hypothetical protein n=1 Tax=Saccharopolyspora pogona TaxID=333966 RepID=UPI001CC23AA0|nr:hypothetical protein [Saccharopolyspora pogona]
MLLRLAYLGVTNAFAMLRLLSMSDRDKGVEILALRQQITVLKRQLDKKRVRFIPSDRAFLAALLHRLPPSILRRRCPRPRCRSGERRPSAARPAATGW